MALRSEIIVQCEDFLTSRVAQQISQSFHQVPQQQQPVSRSCSNGRQPVVTSRRLPVDHVSYDDPPDTPQAPLMLNFTSLLPDDISHGCWTESELSPGDSAVYSDDFSPDGDTSFSHPLSTFDSGYSYAGPSTLLCFDSANHHSVLESCSDPDTRSDQSSDSIRCSLCAHPDQQLGLAEVPRWKSNWSLEDLEPIERKRQKRPSVPLYIPIPKDQMRPRIGVREIDEVSELSNVPSPDGSSGISSSSPASDTECFAEEGAFLSQLHDCRVGVGQVARFRCQVTRGRAVSVTWQHGDKVVENGGRYRLYRSGDTTHSLEIYFVTLADAGVVVCRAISEENAGETSAYLRVRESLLPPRIPEFVYKMESVETIAGDDVELSCKVRGHPVPALAWYFNGRKVTPMDSGLEIEHIGKEEWLVLIDKERLLSSATVRCVAHNPVGEASCAASIILLSAENDNGSRSSSRRVEEKLVHIDKKITKANSRVLDSAEELLSNATQMMSLDKQLKVVDSYLDRIEAKFQPGSRRPHKEASKKSRRKPAAQEGEAELSLIQVSFPPTLVLPPPPPPTNSPSPGPTAIIHRTSDPAYSQPALSLPAAPPPSVSITVLSKHVASDKVRVVFKQSFDQHRRATPTVSTRPVSSADFTIRKPLKYLDIPLNEPLRYLDIPTKADRTQWEEGVRLPAVVLREASMDYEAVDNPYSAENLKRRVAGGPSFFETALDPKSFPPPLTDSDPSQFDRGGGQFDPRDQHSRQYVVKPKRKASPLKKSYLIEPEIFYQAESKVNRASDRLLRLDNRIGILQAELDVERDADIETPHKPEELQRLQSAVDYTAAEIQETERTIKQVELLVTRLHIQQQEPQLHKAERGWTTVSPDYPDCYSYPGLAGSSPSPLVVYGTMTSTPQDFPQDGPSVRSLMSRFQHEKNGLKNGHGENGGHHLGSSIAEDTSDFSATSTPDKDRKPLPVFNRAKFQEGLAAAKSQAKPRIQASITARSLSREMREQLRIGHKPQMGAFRSNIMTAENGDYDPDKAAKAKELAMADSAHDAHLHQQRSQPSPPSTRSDLQQHGHANHTANTTIPSPIQTQSTTARQAMPVFDEEHEHEEHQSDVDPLHSVADSVHSADQGAMESSGTYDMDSLDGDADHDEAEPHYAQIAKKQQQDSAHANDHQVKEEDAGGKVNGHHRTNSNLVMDHHNDGDNDSGAGEGHNEHEAPEHRQHSTNEEEGELPLSQAPNWDLLI
ncbi:hypothetical protein RvY_00402 [Ramazzottius varieornatus]|uniref:Ig-like domain-containing protein n=1 Tax=Ramazzottius varieornatus TaxID=947166 RepID=A0A1D1UCN1_RAMVA|nr:hypothetical protein RvY_00402 [Ramazzottius varieornatus]